MRWALSTLSWRVWYSSGAVVATTYYYYCLDNLLLVEGLSSALIRIRGPSPSPSPRLTGPESSLSLSRYHFPPSRSVRNLSDCLSCQEVAGAGDHVTGCHTLSFMQNQDPCCGFCSTLLSHDDPCWVTNTSQRRFLQNLFAPTVLGGWPGRAWCKYRCIFFFVSHSCYS